MDGREVAFVSLESRTSMLGLGADHLTVRLSEYSSQRTVLIGFRNVINEDYTGTTMPWAARVALNLRPWSTCSIVAKAAQNM